MDPELEELLALNAQEDVPPPPGAVPAPAPSSDPELDELLALNAQDDAPAAPPLPERANVVNPAGQVVSIPRGDLEDALRAGYRLDTSEVDFTRPVSLLEGGRVQTYAPDDPALMERLNAGAQLATPQEVEAEYGDVGSTLATGLEGFARGATFGLSDLAADALGGASYEAERRLREKVNPGTALAFEIAGAGAPALLSGGAGAAGTVARMTPAGRLAQLGTKLGTRLTEKMGASVAGRVGALALTGAAEGAVDNAIRAVTDDLAAGDVEITAERMASAVWDGALYGGLIGGAVGGVVEGAAAASARRGRKALEQITESADELSPTPVPDEAVARARPTAEIDQELIAAEARLAQADEVADPVLREEAEAAVDALLAEKDAAVLVEQGIKSDEAIDVALNVEAPEEVRGVFGRMAASQRKAKDARELARKFDEEADKVGRLLVSELDDQQRSWQNTIAPKISRNNKPKAIALALDAEPPPAWEYGQARKVLDFFEEQLKSIRDVRAEYAKGGDAARAQVNKLKAAEQSLLATMQHLVGTSKTGVIPRNAPILRGDKKAIAEVFWALDNVKGVIGRVAKKRGEVVTRAEAALQRAYMRNRALLQDRSLWGGAADMQTVTNAVEAKTIGANHVFHERFGLSRKLLQENAGEHGFEDLIELDPGKIEALLKNAGEFRNDKVERDFIRGLERRIELAETKARYYGLGKRDLELIAKERARVESVKRHFREVKILKQQRDAAMRAAEEGSPVESVIALLDQAASGVGLGIVGRVARGAANAAANVLDVLGRSAQRTEQAIVSAADRLSGSVDAIGQRLDTLSSTVESLGRGAVKTEQAVDSAATTAVKVLVRGEPASARAAKAVAAVAPTPALVQRAIEDARAVADSRSEAGQNLRAQLDDVAQYSPELAQALERKAVSAAEFILSKLPPIDDRDPFLPGVERPMDRVTQAKVARYISAARNPRGALERLAQGVGTPEDKETLQTLYPALYARWGQQVLERARQQKVPPTMKQRQALQYATGLSFAPWQTPEFTAFAQPSQPAQQPQDESASTQPMVTPGRVKTEFRADQVYASRADSIANPTEW